MRTFPWVFLVACGGADVSTAPVWYGEVDAIVARRCTSCHAEGGLAPQRLDRYEDVEAARVAVGDAVRDGRMPPWQPGDGCASYDGNFDLTPAERDRLLEWVDAGGLEGDPANASGAEVPAAPFPADVELRLPEPYTPDPALPDDYRCQVVAWPLAEPAFLTGVRVEPDRVEMVHHTIVYALDGALADDVAAWDAADPGPGYACYGGPRPVSAEGSWISGEGLALDPEQVALALSGEGEAPAGFGIRWLGAWVPGATTLPFPEGTGLEMSPGALIVVQMHYNTAGTDPLADQSTILMQTAPTVERPAAVVPFADVAWVVPEDLPSPLDALLPAEPMMIPAGAVGVTHTTETVPGQPLESGGLQLAGARRQLGLADDAPLRVHGVAGHMHQLGRSLRLEVERPDVSTTCLLDLPDWDFAWQGAYQLRDEVALGSEDVLRMRCVWDNGAEDQPVINGVQQEPRDVAWGEGTRDEMCLGVLYVTGM